MEHSTISKQGGPPGNADRKRRIRETARDILHNAKVKRQFGDAVDAAGVVALAMEQAYRLGFKDVLHRPTDPEPGLGNGHGHALASVGAPSHEALNWTLIPPRTRSTFCSICLAAFGRDGRTAAPSYQLEATLGDRRP